MRPWVVACFCMRRKVFKNPFQSFAGAEYPFGQMILAEAPYEIAGTYRPDMGSVLTVYVPYCSGASGRARLMAKSESVWRNRWSLI